MNKREKMLFGFALFIFLIFGFFICCTIAKAQDMKVEIKGDTVTMPLASFKALVKVMKNQQHEVNVDDAQVQDMMQILQDNEACVRSKVRQGVPVLPCFNRTQLQNPDHHHPTDDES